MAPQQLQASLAGCTPAGDLPKTQWKPMRRVPPLPHHWLPMTTTTTATTKWNRIPPHLPIPSPNTGRTGTEVVVVSHLFMPTAPALPALTRPLVHAHMTRARMSASDSSRGRGLPQADQSHRLLRQPKEQREHPWEQREERESAGYRQAGGGRDSAAGAT